MANFRATRDEIEERVRQLIDDHGKGSRR
jgi:hypothetical protein